MNPYKNGAKFWDPTFCEKVGIIREQFLERLFCFLFLNTQHVTGWSVGCICQSEWLGA